MNDNPALGQILRISSARPSDGASLEISELIVLLNAGISTAGDFTRPLPDLMFDGVAFTLGTSAAG
jgi:hypothetical protein